MSAPTTQRRGRRPKSHDGNHGSGRVTWSNAQVELIPRALDSLKLHHCARFVRLVAALHRRYGKLPHPSQEWLARELGMDPRTVQRHIAILEGLGFLIVYRSPARPDPHNAGKFRRKVNRYLLCPGKAAQVRACPLPYRHRVAQAVSEGLSGPAPTPIDGRSPCQT